MRGPTLGLAILCTLSAVQASAQPCLVPREQIVSGGPGKDGIPALTTPNLVSASEADFLGSDDLVLGVVVNGEARAYPHAVLWWHEVVNDVLGGKPVLVTFCPLTGSGIVFDPEVDGRVLNFGVSGLLFDNNLLLFDRATDSLWSQMQLRAVCGRFQSASPRLVPVVQSTWTAWRALYPETTVVSFDTGFRRNYRVYPYGDYDQLENDDLLFPQSVIDRRLPLKENVLGIVHDGVARAYSTTRMAQVATRFTVNDDVNGLPVLVVADSEAQLTVAFDRRLATTGERLDFEVEDGSVFPLLVRDRQTRSLWSLTGEAVEGPLAGETLARIPSSYVAFWFAWASFHPESEIHDPSPSP